MSEAEAKKTEGKDAAEAHGLEYIYQTMNLAVPQQAVDLAQYKNTEALASSNASDRIGAALAVFIDSVASSTQSVDKIDKAMLDYHIAEIDRKLSMQLDEILHHPSFQKIRELLIHLLFLTLMGKGCISKTLLSQDILLSEQGLMRRELALSWSFLRRKDSGFR